MKVEFKAVGPEKVTQARWSWVSRKEKRVPDQPGVLQLSGRCAERRGWWRWRAGQTGGWKVAGVGGGVSRTWKAREKRSKKEEGRTGVSVSEPRHRGSLAQRGRGQAGDTVLRGRGLGWLGARTTHLFLQMSRSRSTTRPAMRVRQIQTMVRVSWRGPVGGSQAGGGQPLGPGLRPRGLAAFPGPGHTLLCPTLPSTSFPFNILLSNRVPPRPGTV